MQKRQPPPNHPWIIGTLPRGANKSHHQQFHCPCPNPRHYGIKSIKVQWHAFLMFKMLWDTTTLQFPMCTWIHQPCRLPKKKSFPPTSHTCEIKICSAKQNKLYSPNETNKHTRWYYHNVECETFYFNIFSFTIFLLYFFC